VVKEIDPDKISVTMAGHLGGAKTAALHGRNHFVNAGKGNEYSVSGIHEKIEVDGVS